MVDLDKSADTPEGARPSRSRWPWVLALTALLALAVGVSAAALLLDSPEEVKPRRAVAGQPQIVSPADLRSFAISYDGPVFWGGRRAGQQIELTEMADARVFVRYLPAGAKAGDKRELLTIATYPQVDAYAKARAGAKRKGQVSETAPGGGLLVYTRKNPRNVFLAYAGMNELIEVFDPSGQARTEVLNGRIGPVR